MTIERACTVRAFDGRLVEARFVATATDGMQWFECDGHGPEEHANLCSLTGANRVDLEPLAELLKRAHT